MSETTHDLKGPHTRMLGRKDYKQLEVDNAQKAVRSQLTAFRQLRKAAEAAGDKSVTAALDKLEPILFNHMVLVLDRYFVHRLRMITGKDGNPVNEVELLTESL